MVDRRLRALSDPTRRDIVARTMQRDYAVTDLAAEYPMSFAAVQRHVAVLEDAGLVVKRPVHRHRFVRARPEALDEVQVALTALRDEWHERVERMHDILADEPGGPG
ncbi:MAG: ArsR/SmtB family transcription factor [Microthrixaceae bacterium]